jgi:hypothetical protein
MTINNAAIIFNVFGAKFMVWDFKLVKASESVGRFTARLTLTGPAIIWIIVC